MVAAVAAAAAALHWWRGGKAVRPRTERRAAGQRRRTGSSQTTYSIGVALPPTDVDRGVCRRRSARRGGPHRKRERRHDDDDRVVISQLAWREDAYIIITHHNMKLPLQPSGSGEASSQSPGSAANTNSSRSGLKLGIVRLGRAGGKVGYIST